MYWIETTKMSPDTMSLKKRQTDAIVWFRKDDDVRWQFGVPPKGNANFAWVQHFIRHLAPHGMADFVLANGSMSSDQSGDCNARSAHQEWASNSQGLGSQRDIRRALIEADLVDTAVRDSAILQREAAPQVLSAAKNNMVALHGQLFYSTQIPDCLWFPAPRGDGTKTLLEYSFLSTNASCLHHPTLAS